jgi:2-dehydropantoate 2-reductase
MKITVVGAGAMGGTYGGLLAVAGHEVRLIDAWQAHVDAINRDGLRLDGVLGEHRVRVPASSAPIGGGADIVIVFVDSNNTGAAAETAARVLAPEGLTIPTTAASFLTIKSFPPNAWRAASCVLDLGTWLELVSGTRL